MEQEGTPQPPQEGVGGDRIPGAGDGIPNVGDGNPDVGDVIPDAGDAIPNVGDAIPDAGDGIPDIVDRIPGAGDAIPNAGDGIPSIGFIIPGAGGTIPSAGDGSPSLGDGIPDVGDAIPGIEGMIPGVGDGILGTGDGIPGTGDRIPGVGDAIPSAGDAIPGTGDGIPGAGDRSPGTGRESPAPAGEGVGGRSGQREGVSGPEGPPGNSPEEQPLQEEGSPAAAAPQPVPGAVAEPPRAQPPARAEDFYCVKWIRWKGERTPMVTQSENGPCPLLAIINILLLQWKVKLPPQKEVITAEELMAHLGNCILATQPRDTSEGLQLNFQQNISDTMTVLPKLSTGLDVNVRFTGVSDFEYTPECIVFDLLNIPLYHGWLVDPQSPEQVQAVGKLSYNQLVEKIITCKHASDSGLVSEGLVAEHFLESTASQLTFHGLCELTAHAREGELGVFFRNNHFSTMTKHKGHLYLLVTDQGFLHEERVVWESLHSVDGDSCFCDAEFHLSHPLGKEGATVAPPDHRLQQRQVDQDYMVALSLQQGLDTPSVLSDLELARQLQHEEYQQHHPHPHPHPHPAPPQLLPAEAGGRPAGERRQRQRPDLDCTLL
ncbi:ubiquitin carboxyl-terminal hydrolase MINDY-1 [Vidua macroura]|uniref:ubiquitin carboxyl-terminal hydrolase MINDY-1 n=1 Tax=Vidua macroura TaxID=187451 RepID=UPI0023A8DF81|nr:ubiquitin carboxyl-terminal hydrolase MINDY-1 [Vidua macroura]